MEFEDLIGRLCVTAGIIMEDASVGAILFGISEDERVAKLLRASEAISALAYAASKLAGYSREASQSALRPIVAVQGIAIDTRKLPFFQTDGYQHERTQFRSCG